MPHQPESERYIVGNAIRTLGFDIAKQVTEDYIKNYHKEENPIKSSKYWWQTGIYANANKKVKVQQMSQPKTIFRKCEQCKTKQEFKENELPDYCPLCEDGQLLSAVEWGVRFPANPQPKVTQVLTDEEQYHKDNVSSFLEKFSSKR